MSRRRLCPRCLRTVEDPEARWRCPRCEAVPLPAWLRGPEALRPRVADLPRPRLERWLLERWRPPECPRHWGVGLELSCECGGPLPDVLCLGAVPPIGLAVEAAEPERRCAEAIDELGRLRPDVEILRPEAETPGGACVRLRAPDRDRILVLRVATARPGAQGAETRFAAWCDGVLLEDGRTGPALGGDRGVARFPAPGGGPRKGSLPSAGRALEWLLRAEIGLRASGERRVG